MISVLELDLWHMFFSFLTIWPCPLVMSHVEFSRLSRSKILEHCSCTKLAVLHNGACHYSTLSSFSNNSSSQADSSRNLG
jgi:hypothetical protein